MLVFTGPIMCCDPLAMNRVLAHLSNWTAFPEDHVLGWVEFSFFKVHHAKIELTYSTARLRREMQELAWALRVLEKTASPRQHAWLHLHTPCSAERIRMHRELLEACLPTVDEVEMDGKQNIGRETAVMEACGLVVAFGNRKPSGANGGAVHKIANELYADPDCDLISTVRKLHEAGNLRPE